MRAFELVFTGKRWDAERAEPTSTREHASISDHLEFWWVDRGCQTAEQAQGIPIDRDRTVRERAFELDPNEPILEQAHALLRQRRSQSIFAKRFARTRIVGRGRGGGVQREAGFGDRQADAMRRPDSSRSTIAAAAAFGSGRAKAGHGGGGKRGKPGLLLCRAVVDQHRLAAALDDAAFLETHESTRTRIVCKRSATSVLESEGRGLNSSPPPPPRRTPIEYDLMKPRRHDQLWHAGGALFQTTVANYSEA